MKKLVSFLIPMLLAFTASSMAGDLPPPPSSVQAPFSNAIGGNLWITLARNGKTFDRAIQADALVCSGTGGPLELAFTPSEDVSGIWFGKVPANFCRCVPRPSYLLVENLDGKQGDFTGTFQWVRAGRCVSVTGDSNLNSPKPPIAPPTLIPSPAKKASSTCEPLGPTGGEYTAKCRIALPGGAGARICHDKNWVVSKDGQNFPKTAGFPERFIRVVTDPVFLNQNDPHANYDVHASYIAPGCIDLIGVSEAWFALNGDQNVDTTQVKQMDYTVQRLLR